LRGYSYAVSDDYDSLKRLSESKSDYERGLALGFPEQDSAAFGTVIDGEKRDGTYCSVSLAKALQSGIKLPEWLGYISYIPKDLDFVNGKVSESAKEQGTKYRDFVNENNPSLAKRVEEFFYSHNNENYLPISWKIKEDGSYDCSYKAV
jgi:hypothetical protein